MTSHLLLREEGIFLGAKWGLSERKGDLGWGTLPCKVTVLDFDPGHILGSEETSWG